MLLYADYPRASIRMVDNESIRCALRLLRDSCEIDYIFETGTFQGDGSTRLLASIFDKSGVKKLITCEVDKSNFDIAKNNLKDYDFVECRLGLSVSLDEALAFLDTDGAINNHEKFPHIYIDDLKDPKAFYSNEVKGRLLDKDNQKIVEDNLINEILPNLNGTLLVNLDSAGGIGFLEFKSVFSLVKDREKFFILIDDTHHLKHFRSKQFIEQNEFFTVLADDPLDGWMLAEYNNPRFHS